MPDAGRSPPSHVAPPLAVAWIAGGGRMRDQEPTNSSFPRPLSRQFDRGLLCAQKRPRQQGVDGATSRPREMQRSPHGSGALYQKKKRRQVLTPRRPILQSGPVATGRVSISAYSTCFKRDNQVPATGTVKVPPGQLGPSARSRSRARLRGTRTGVTGSRTTGGVTGFDLREQQTWRKPRWVRADYARRRGAWGPWRKA